MLRFSGTPHLDAQRTTLFQPRLSTIPLGAGAVAVHSGGVGGRVHGREYPAGLHRNFPDSCGGIDGFSGAESRGAVALLDALRRNAPFGFSLPAAPIVVLCPALEDRAPGIPRPAAALASIARPARDDLLADAPLGRSACRVVFTRPPRAFGGENLPRARWGAGLRRIRCPRDLRQKNRLGISVLSQGCFFSPGFRIFPESQPHSGVPSDWSGAFAGDHSWSLDGEAACGVSTRRGGAWDLRLFFALRVHIARWGGFPRCGSVGLGGDARPGASFSGAGGFDFGHRIFGGGDFLFHGKLGARSRARVLRCFLAGCRICGAKVWRGLLGFPLQDFSRRRKNRPGLPDHRHRAWHLWLCRPVLCRCQHRRGDSHPSRERLAHGRVRVRAAVPRLCIRVARCLDPRLVAVPALGHLAAAMGADRRGVGGDPPRGGGCAASPCGTRLVGSRPRGVGFWKSGSHGNGAQQGLVDATVDFRSRWSGASRARAFARSLAVVRRSAISSLPRRDCGEPNAPTRGKRPLRGRDKPRPLRDTALSHVCRPLSGTRLPRDQEWRQSHRGGCGFRRRAGSKSR